MLKVGLTGGIGSGKTTVARIFEVLGVPVYYADLAAKNLMNENANVKNAIIDAFGEQCYNNGFLNRQYLSTIVFNNAEKIQLLNSIVHPATINDAMRWFGKQTSRYVVKEAALIFESGSNKELDFVIGVKSPPELRIQRAMARDNITSHEVELRMNKQMDEEEKMRLCDYVIINDEQQMLIPQVLTLHSKLLKQTGL